MKTRVQEIMDGLLGVNLPSPLQKIKCGGCGLATSRRDIEAVSGLCQQLCYPQYCDDMRTMEERSESESEAYRYSH